MKNTTARLRIHQIASHHTGPSVGKNHEFEDRPVGSVPDEIQNGEKSENHPANQRVQNM